MQRFQNTYTGGMTSRPGGDWQSEISGDGMAEANPRPAAGDTTMWRAPAEAEYITMPNGRQLPAGSMPGMRTDLPDEIIQSPVSSEEAFRGSLKAMLARNVGNYVVATFLVGTQGTVSWEGVLHDVGNDFITIYQPGRERYIVIDIYSLKYIEFYDSRRQARCEAMLHQDGWENHY